MQNESKTGMYDLVGMVAEGKISKFLDNHGDYISQAVKVLPVESATKQQGVVAVKTIPAGSLIAACKAFAYVPFCQGVDFSAQNEKLYCATMDQLFVHPKRNLLPSLFAGEGIDYADTAMNPDRIRAILKWNRIVAAPDFTSSQNGNSLGLWLFPSNISRTCVGGNCSFMFIGNFVFVRATKEIKAEELVKVQFTPNNVDQEERIRELTMMRCDCQLCQFLKSQPEKDKTKYIRVCNIIAEEKHKPLVQSRLEILQKMAENLRPKFNFALASVLEMRANAYRRSGEVTQEIKICDECLQFWIEIGDISKAMQFAARLAEVADLYRLPNRQIYTEQVETLAEQYLGDSYLLKAFIEL